MPLYRMWINQPSTLQPLHKLHGVNVLYDVDTATAYFLEGPVISQIIKREWLSRGWNINS